jgi:hypothetical protein
LERADLGRIVLQAVIRALGAERLQRGPGFLEDVQVLICRSVALVLEEVVAIAPLFGVIAASDGVHRDAAFGELIQRGKRPRREGGKHEARTVGDEKV